MAKYSGIVSGSTAFSSVIGKAITDFDSIFDALYNKKVTYNGNLLNTNTTGVRTDEYDDLISAQLFRVGNLDSSTVVTVDGKIVDYSGTNVNAGSTPTVTYSGSTATIVSTISAAGYYTSTSTVTGTINTSTVSLSGALDKSSVSPYSYTAGTSGAPGTFVITPAANSILRQVTVAEGKVEVSITDAGVSTSVLNTMAATLANGTPSGIKLELEDGVDDSDDYVAFGLNVSSIVQSDITVAPEVDFSEGYISDEPVLNSTTYPTITAPTEYLQSTIYLPKGSINASLTGAGLTIDDDQTQAIIARRGDANTSQPADTYQITVSQTGGSISGTVTPGWISDNNNFTTGNISSSTTKLFIAKGSVPDNSVGVTLSVNSGSVDVDSSDNDAYTVTVSRLSSQEATTTTSITPGYIVDDEYTTTTTVTPLELKIPAGHASVSDTLSPVTYTSSIGTTTAPTAANLSKYYTIVPNITVTSSYDSSSSKEGYIIPGATTITGSGLTNAQGTTLYVPKGHVTLTHGLTPTTGSGSILLSEQPEGTEGADYYKVTTSGSMTLDTEGYITSADLSTGSSVSYYVKKAQLQYVENDSTSGSIIQVVSGGFIPSGTISTIDIPVSGSLDMAAVIGTLSDNSSGVLKKTSNSGDYAISISKAATTNAGYISGTAAEGSLSLDDTYYVAHGHITVTPTIDSVTFGNIVKVAGSGATPTKYTITATAAATNNNTTTSFTEGYIKSADVTLSSITNVDNTVELPEAVLGVTVGSAELSSTATGMQTVSSSDYFVTPALSKATVQAVVSSAGYVDTTVTSASGQEVSVSSSNTPNLYIKAGTSQSFTNPTSFSPSLQGNPFLTNSQAIGDDYTVTLAGTAQFTATLDEGYYGTAGSNKQIVFSQPVSGSTTVAHGHVTIDPTAATIQFTNNGITPITELGSGESSSHYASISAAATSVSLSYSGSTTGFVHKGNSLDWTMNSALNSNNSNGFYIKKYAYNGDSGSTSTAVSSSTYIVGNESIDVYVPSYGNFASNESETDGIVNDIILNTDAVYSDKKILVKLGANAMGSNVQRDLTSLNNRLAGTLTRAAAGA